MAKTKPSPEKIIKKLESPAPMVEIGMIDGIDVEATIDEEKLVFHNRLDAFSRPSKQQALAMLTKLHACYTELCESSEPFRKFIGNRRFAAELYVFSGQMDFSVATMDKNSVKWHLDLDDRKQSWSGQKEH